MTLVECETKYIDDGDELELDIEGSKMKDVSKGFIFETKPLHPVMKRLLLDGGVVEHFRKYGGFHFEEL